MTCTAKKREELNAILLSINVKIPSKEKFINYNYTIITWEEMKYTNCYDFTYLCPFAPPPLSLLSFVLINVFGERLPEPMSGQFGHLLSVAVDRHSFDCCLLGV
jgi:hypothetical protein